MGGMKSKTPAEAEASPPQEASILTRPGGRRQEVEHHTRPEAQIQEVLAKIAGLLQTNPALGERALRAYAALHGLSPGQRSYLEALRPFLTPSRRERAREAFQAPTCATSRRACPATPTPRTTPPRGCGSTSGRTP